MQQQNPPNTSDKTDVNVKMYIHCVFYGFATLRVHLTTTRRHAKNCYIRNVSTILSQLFFLYSTFLSPVVVSILIYPSRMDHATSVEELFSLKVTTTVYAAITHLLILTNKIRWKTCSSEVCHDVAKNVCVLVTYIHSISSFWVSKNIVVRSCTHYILFIL